MKPVNRIAKELFLVPTTFAAFLLFAAGTSIGQPDRWQLLDRTNDGEVFVERSARRSVGGVVRLWVLTNYKSPILLGQFATPAKSSKFLILVECRTEKIAIADVNYYTGSFGEGNPIWNKTTPDSELNWNYSPPQSAGEVYVDQACR